MNIGQLSVKYRCERSWHGIEPSVLKSGMQKYLRRNDRDSGLWCLVEMDLFSLATVYQKELAKKEGTSEVNILSRARSLRTNMINRLVVMISEEVNIHNALLPARAKDLYQRWMATRDEEQSRVYLVAFYLGLLASGKCRIISDYKTIFNLPPFYLPDSQRDKLVLLHKNFLQENDTELYKINYEQNVASLDSKTLATRALSVAKEGKDEALFWCGQLLLRRDATKLVAWLWSELLAMKFLEEELRALHFFYQEMTHKEQPIYLYHALLLIIFREKLSLTKKVDADIQEDEVRALYEKHQEEKPLGISEFVKDIHTGKKNKDGRFVFAVEGALIENEDKTFFSARYRDLYIKFKKVLDQKSKSMTVS
jgi:hypothetical protein